MSVTMLVYLNRTLMPTREAWAQAIHRAGFPMDLDSDFDPFQDTGFRPCKYEGEEAGFEFYVEDVDMDDSDEELPEEYWATIAERDTVVQFVTHSKFRDLMTSIIASGVLASIADGVLVDAESGDVVPSQDALTWSKRGEIEIKEDLKTNP